MIENNLENKTCIHCKQIKHKSEFMKFRNECLLCYRAYHRKKQRERKLKNPEHIKELNRKSYFLNKEERNRGMEDYKKKNINKIIFNTAKYRAKQRNIEFTLELSDIIIPEYCPILGIKLEINYGKGRIMCDSSPSLDRINSDKGYVKENICIISWKANRIKNDGNAQEHRKIADWMEKMQNIS